MIPIQGILRWTHLLDLGGTMYLHALLGLITRDQFHRNLYEKFRATQPSPSAPAAADWSSIFRKWVDVASSESDDGESGDLNTNDNSLGFLSQSRAIIAVGGFGLLTFSPIRERKKKKRGREGEREKEKHFWSGEEHRRQILQLRAWQHSSRGCGSWVIFF